MNKKLIAPIVTIAATFAMAVGTTYAMFTRNVSKTVDVTSGKIDVSIDMTMSEALSRYLDEPPFDAMANAVTLGGDHDAVFELTGTGDLESETLTLDRIAPTDQVTTKVSVTNASNISIKWRYGIQLSGELIPALDIKLGDQVIDTSVTDTTIYQPWSTAIEPSVTELIPETNFVVTFPDDVDNNDYQGKTGQIKFLVETVQGNMEVHDPAVTKYGFGDSYLVDEGLETEHWVHEITNVDEFRNIVDSSVHSAKTGRQQYPGSLNEKTVYLIKNNIDFGGGEIWNTSELIEDVNKYPFIGKLIGDGDGVTLSNVHVTTLYSGIDNNSTSCFFGRTINSSFENLTISNCSINNSSADKAGILVAGNKTKQGEYRTLLEDQNFVSKTIEFKNILIDETCSVFAAENGAGIAACLRFTNGIVFEDCVNKASITATKNNIAGIVGNIAYNPSDASGDNNAPITITNCENYGEICGSGASVAGIVGYLAGTNGVLTNCKNFGSINFNSTANTSGSIVGQILSGSKFVNCYNEGIIFTKGSTILDFNSTDTMVLYGDKTTVTMADKEDYLAQYKQPYTGNIIDMQIDKENKAINVSTTDGADHYSMVISTTKVDIDPTTNKAVPQRSGTILIGSWDNLDATAVNNFKLINQMGYFAPSATIGCPVDEYHGSTRIGSRAQFVTSTYFLDYSLHGQTGYEPGYGTNSKGGYFVLDNTGNDGYWPCLITFRPNVFYNVVGFDAEGKIISNGQVVYSPYTLGGDNNYTTEIVKYVAE